MEYEEYTKKIELNLTENFEKRLFQAALLNLSETKNPLR
jgi:hypothetical protein